MLVQIQEGYLGMCAHVAPGVDCKADADHFEFCLWEKPLPAMSLPGDIEFPEVIGIWEAVCKEHCDPNRDHK